MRNGMGYFVDLGFLDQLIQVQNPYDATVDVFSDRGSLAHLAAGALAAYSGDGAAIALSTLFAGYEVAKLYSGESPQRIAGSLIEFGIGALIAAILIWGDRKVRRA